MARLLALCSHVGVRKWAEQIGRHSLNPPPFQLVPVPQVSLTVTRNDGLRLSGLLGGGRGASSTPTHSMELKSEGYEGFTKLEISSARRESIMINFIAFAAGRFFIVL